MLLSNSMSHACRPHARSKREVGGLGTERPQWPQPNSAGRRPDWQLAVTLVSPIVNMDTLRAASQIARPFPPSIVSLSCGGIRFDSPGTTSFPNRPMRAPCAPLSKSAVRIDLGSFQTRLTRQPQDIE